MGDRILTGSDTHKGAKMAHYTKLINPATKQTKEVKQGFSWVTLFFGIFVPAVRGHFSYFFILLGLSFLGGLGIFIAWFICPFVINKHYLQWLITQGFVPLEEYEKQCAKEEEDRQFKQAMMAKMVAE